MELLNTDLLFTDLLFTDLLFTDLLFTDLLFTDLLFTDLLTYCFSFFLPLSAEYVVNNIVIAVYVWQ